MTSYKGLLNKIEAFCAAHLQIQKYGGEFREQMPNFSTEDERYPIVYVVPSGDLSDLNTNQFTLDVYCVDIIQKDRANINTIVSDCNLIVNDLYLYFLDGNDLSIDVIGATSGTPINNFDLDYSAGWMKTITFEVGAYSVCAIPMNPINPNPPVVCDSATYNLLDTLDNILSSGTINSGANANIVVRDASVENSNASYADVILAEGTLVLPDIRIDVVNSASTIVNTTTSPSVIDMTISAPDGTVNIKKFGDGTIHSEVVASGATVNYSVADNAITVNNANAFTIDATDPLDIRLQDSNGTTLTPNSVSPNQAQHHVDIVLPAPTPPTYATARVLKTGQTVSTATHDDGATQRGRLTSFLVLSVNNPFGNTNRFTDKSGGQTYTNKVAYDWSTFDGSSVSAYYFGDANTRAWATQLSQYYNSTIDGLNRWYLFNIHEAFSLMNFSYPNSYLYGYAPFSLTRRYMWVSTNETGTTGIATETAMGGAPFTASNKASGLWGIWTRVCTVTGTTIT